MELQTKMLERLGRRLDNVREIRLIFTIIFILNVIPAGYGAASTARAYAYEDYCM